MRHQTILEYKQFRYLKFTVVMLILCIGAYAWHTPPVGPYGGTVLGYVLGTLGALIILLLIWFGVRKRQYRKSMTALQGWLSAHVYLGTSLIIIATLHTGFEFGWNIHTLAYVLMIAVILSGFYGVYAYMSFPSQLTSNLGEETLETIFLKVAALDNEARRIAVQLPDEINRVVLASAQKTTIGGGVLSQLSGRQRNCPTAHAVEAIKEAGSQMKDQQMKLNLELYSLMLRKKALVERGRTDIMLKARMDLWLYFHVPFSIALLAALTAHIVSVFFYW